MSQLTLRPDGTVSATGVTITGAATAHAAVSDDSDASYIELNATGETARFTLTTGSIPAGAVPVMWGFKTRVAKVGASNPGARRHLLNGVPYPVNESMSNITNTTPLTWASLGLGDVIATQQTILTAIAGLETSVEQLVAGTLRVYEVYVVLVYATKPTVVVDAPASPVSNTNLPTVAWTGTFDSDNGDGVANVNLGAQTHYEVKVFNDAQYLAGGFNPATSTPFSESGIVASSGATWQVDDLLPDDTYRAYVRVGQTPGSNWDPTYRHWSDWAFKEFTLAVALPAVPTLVLTADAANGRMEIDLDDVAGPATTDFFEVQRSLDGGTTWEPVRVLSATGLITPAGGLATVFDYEAPNGLTVQYRARAAHSYSGVLAYSAWTSSTSSWTGTTWWIKDPLDPSRNLTIIILAYNEVQRAARQGILQPLGAPLPIVVSDTRAGPAGVIALRTDTASERDDLDNLLDRTVLIQGPPADGEPDRYVRLGDTSRQRIGGLRSTAPQRTETLAWTEVASPTGVVTAWP